MRRAIVAIGSTVAGTALLVGLKAGLLSPQAATVSDPPVVDAPDTRGAPTGSNAANAPGKLRAGTFAGSVVRTKYGPVQVRVVVAAGGRLTDVVAVQMPAGDENSTRISARAGPTLREEALTAQSASIATVSGATYTSTGYASSLQAALDTAKQI